MTVENEQAREWYLNEAAAGTWSSRQLGYQVSILDYEYLLANRNNGSIRAEADEIMGYPCNIDTFLLQVSDASFK